MEAVYLITETAMKVLRAYLLVSGVIFTTGLVMILIAAGRYFRWWR